MHTRSNGRGIGCLWVDFSEWAVKHDSLPCERKAFERLLEGEGFRLKDGLASGLVLRVDLDDALRSVDDGVDTA